ncbi:hypothetical protein ERJ77_24375, partial [Vibrio anguillarum]|nr:hypothetical protein [Vibrio anguillarum]
MSDTFGEIVELYTATAVMQFQRIPVMKKNKKIECLNVTLAPLMDSGRGNKTANFDKKMVIQLKESGMANLAAALMGF